MKKMMESFLNPNKNKTVKIKNSENKISKETIKVNCSECEENNSETAFYEMKRIESEINMNNNMNMNILPFLEFPNDYKIFSDNSTDHNENSHSTIIKNLYSNEVASMKYNYFFNKYV